MKVDWMPLQNKEHPWQRATTTMGAQNCFRSGFPISRLESSKFAKCRSSILAVAGSLARGRRRVVGGASLVGFSRAKRIRSPSVFPIAIPPHCLRGQARQQRVLSNCPSETWRLLQSLQQTIPKAFEVTGPLRTTRLHKR